MQQSYNSDYTRCQCDSNLQVSAHRMFSILSKSPLPIHAWQKNLSKSIILQASGSSSLNIMSSNTLSDFTNFSKFVSYQNSDHCHNYTTFHKSSRNSKLTIPDEVLPICQLHTDLAQWRASILSDFPLSILCLKNLSKSISVSPSIWK